MTEHPHDSSSAPKPANRTDEKAVIPLEQTDDAAAETESCPQCGGGMKQEQLVCLRCGYNIRELKTATTKVMTAPAEGESADEEDEAAEAGTALPLVRVQWFDPWGSIAVAGASTLILLIGYLAGAQGLFPEAALAISQAAEAGTTEPTVAFVERVSAVARFIVLALLWTGCGLAGLFLLAQILNRAFGELATAALRMAAIVTSMRLVTFINLSSPPWERLLEFTLQVAAFFTLTLLLFHLSPRNAGIVSIIAIFAFLLLWLSSTAILWATG